jgi:hypothetical protein
MSKKEEALPQVGSHLGDMYSRLDEQHQNYWDINRRSIPMPGRTPVVGPTCPPKRTPPSMQCEPPPGFPPAIWEFMRDRYFAAMHETLQTFKEDLKCGTYFVKSPNWIEPTATSIRVDEKTSFRTPVILLPGVETTVLQVSVPDLTIGVLWGVANLCCEASDWFFVQWFEKRNEALMKNGQYDGQKCPFNDVSRDREAVPIIIPPLGTFKLNALNTGALPIEVVARLTGHLIPLKDTATDGSFDQFHVI